VEEDSFLIFLETGALRVREEGLQVQYGRKWWLGERTGQETEETRRMRRPGG
jgi:hypothetical protein